MADNNKNNQGPSPEQIARIVADAVASAMTQFQTAGTPAVSPPMPPIPVEAPAENSRRLSAPQRPVHGPKERIEEELLNNSLTPQQLAKVVGSSINVVNDHLKSLRDEHRIYNVGMGESPRWTLRIGDKTDTPTLRRLMERLLRERPMMARELADATGARQSRVAGVLVEIQRSGANIVDMSGGQKDKIYFIIGNTKDMKLEPRGSTRADRAAAKSSKKSG